MKRLLLAAMLLSSFGASLAGQPPVPSGPAVLSVRGAISNTNDDRRARFDPFDISNDLHDEKSFFRSARRIEEIKVVE